jgi:hypothetical protein
MRTGVLAISRQGRHHCAGCLNDPRGRSNMQRNCPNFACSAGNLVLMVLNALHPSSVRSAIEMIAATVVPGVAISAGPRWPPWTATQSSARREPAPRTRRASSRSPAVRCSGARPACERDGEERPDRPRVRRRQEQPTHLLADQRHADRGDQPEQGPAAPINRCTVRRRSRRQRRTAPRCRADDRCGPPGRPCACPVHAASPRLRLRHGHRDRRSGREAPCESIANTAMPSSRSCSSDCDAARRVVFWPWPIARLYRVTFMRSPRRCRM